MTFAMRPAFDRLFRTTPELEKPENRTGVAFVSILFGLVVTEAALDFSTELAKWWDDGRAAVQESRLAHLAVGISVTALSWIGYHQSQQYPPFVIKFVNIPFFQFCLDVLMVVTYHSMVVVAETSQGDQVPTPSAVPEATLLLVVFVLYTLWDVLGYRLAHDREYAIRYTTPREHQTRFGTRRWVTVAFLGISALTAVVVWLWHPAAPGQVFAIDVVLVFLALAYRAAKQALDENVRVRTAPAS